MLAAAVGLLVIEKNASGLKNRNVVVYSQLDHVWKLEHKSSCCHVGMHLCDCMYLELCIYKQFTQEDVNSR